MEPARDQSEKPQLFAYLTTAGLFDVSIRGVRIEGLSAHEVVDLARDRQAAIRCRYADDPEKEDREIHHSIVAAMRAKGFRPMCPDCDSRNVGPTPCPTCGS